MASAFSSAGKTPASGGDGVSIASLRSQLSRLGYVIPPTPPDNPSQRGRPISLTEDIHVLILSALTRGAAPQLAADFAMVSYESLRNWKKIGRAGNDQYLSLFYQNYKKARAHFVMTKLSQIDKIGQDKKEWAAHFTVLERLFPKQYGRNRAEVESLKAQVAVLEAENHRLRTAPPKFDEPTLAAMISGLHPDIQRTIIKAVQLQEWREANKMDPPPPKAKKKK